MHANVNQQHFARKFFVQNKMHQHTMLSVHDQRKKNRFRLQKFRLFKLTSDSRAQLFICREQFQDSQHSY